MRYFVGVAEELHFGRAAERLYISTPTLSQQIRQLEREVGTTLLIRHSRGVELTPAGQVFLARARETIQAAGLALKDTRRVVGLDEPVLRLGLLNGFPAGSRPPSNNFPPSASRTVRSLSRPAPRPTSSGCSPPARSTSASSAPHWRCPRQSFPSSSPPRNSLEGRPVIARYAVIWRTESNNPVLRAMTVSPGLTVVRQQVVED